jgi:hypothetical protein
MNWLFGVAMTGNPVMRIAVLASILLLPIAAVGQVPEPPEPSTICSTEQSPRECADISPPKGPFTKRYIANTKTAEDVMSSSSREMHENYETAFVAPTFSMEPNTKRWHTLDRKFVLFSFLSASAAFVDMVTTSRDLAAHPLATELDPLFGKRPSNARLYGTGVPLELLFIGWSYHVKKIAPRRNTWKVMLTVSAVAHTAAAVNNLTVGP